MYLPLFFSGGGVIGRRMDLVFGQIPSASSVTTVSTGQPCARKSGISSRIAIGSITAPERICAPTIRTLFDDSDLKIADLVPGQPAVDQLVVALDLVFQMQCRRQVRRTRTDKHHIHLDLFPFDHRKKYITGRNHFALAGWVPGKWKGLKAKSESETAVTFTDLYPFALTL